MVDQEEAHRRVEEYLAKKAGVRERIERAEREADAFMERLMPADNVVDLAAWRRRRGR